MSVTLSLQCCKVAENHMKRVRFYRLTLLRFMLYFIQITGWKANGNGRSFMKFAICM